MRHTTATEKRKKKYVIHEEENKKKKKRCNVRKVKEKKAHYNTQTQKKISH